MFKKVYTARRVIVPELVLALPSSPSNGDQCIFTDSVSAPTYQWLLQYVAAKASNKWICLGGTPIRNQVSTAEGRANTSYGALATAQAITLPLAGDYDIEQSMSITTAGGTQASGAMSYSVGATASSDVWAAIAVAVVASLAKLGSGHRRYRWSALAASTVVTAEFRSPNAADSITYAGRVLSAHPFAVGG